MIDLNNLFQDISTLSLGVLLMPWFTGTRAMRSISPSPPLERSDIVQFAIKNFFNWKNWFGQIKLVTHLPHLKRICSLLKQKFLYSILGAVLNTCNHMFAKFVESCETISYRCIHMFSIFNIYSSIHYSIYLQKKPYDPAIKMREFLYLMKVWSTILHINLKNLTQKRNHKQSTLIKAIHSHIL